MRVFLSSTWRDLRPEREAVERALDRLATAAFTPMEYFASRPETSPQASLREVDRSDIFVGIFGHRYESGIIEAAYARARQRGLPCLIFFKEDHDRPEAAALADGQESPVDVLKLRTLKSTVARDHRVSYFSTPEQLATLVVIALYNLSEGAASDVPSPGARPPRRHNLPAPVNSFVGREAEIRELSRLLTTARLLTLTGSGGAGKTRLALQVAAGLGAEAFPDGVWLVELAELGDASLLAPAVATALGLHDEPTASPRARLSDYLRERRLLLVLDSCERFVDACGQLATDFLQSCPDVRLLATSRTVLDIAGEVAFQVPSLPVPDVASPVAPAELMRHAGARLFVERAEAYSPTFSMTPQTATAVAQVCHQLDGIPLAIEIAAARVRVLSVEQIASRLDDRFGLLTGGNRLVRRHQTLRAAVDWSYELLLDTERLLFNRLSVFAWGWTLDAAERVCAGDGISAADILDLLASLVSKSLVLAEGASAGAPRYRMLETLRLYGTEKLEQSGEAEQLRRRHLDWCIEFAHQAEVHYTEPDQAMWLQRTKAEHGNIRLALTFALRHGDGESAAQLAAAVWRYWDVGGFVGEGRGWLNAALEASPAASVARARALTSNGYLALLQADVMTACVLLEEGLALSRELSDDVGIGTTLIILGMAARARGSLGLAEDLVQEALSMTRRAGHRLGTFSALYLLASVVELQGDHDRALALHEESLRLKREHGDVWGIAVSLWSLATLAQERGENDRARAFFKESLELRAALQDRDGIADCLDGLAREASASGSAERAALLYGAAEALRESIGLAPPPHAATADAYLAQTRAALGEDELAAAWSRGRALPLDLAITLAVATDGGSQPAAVGPRTTGPVAAPQAVVITHRGGSGNAAVLFVHGFNAKPHLTWGSFPDLLMADPRLGDWDVFSVGYPTSVQFDLASIWTADPPLVSVADNLRVVASLPPLRHYHRLALVAHSMGGLVVQRALVDDDEFAARAGHVFLFACPSLGSRKARFVRLWKRQLRDMARGSGFIADLRERWAKKFSPPPFYFKAIAGDIDEFVSRRTTLEPFPAQTRAVVHGNHLTLVYALTAQDQCVQLVIQGLLSNWPLGPAPGHHAASRRGGLD